jgi:hypothetical protein
MITTTKVNLYPNEKQKRLLEKHFGSLSIQSISMRCSGIVVKYIFLYSHISSIKITLWQGVKQNSAKSLFSGVYRSKIQRPLDLDLDGNIYGSY